VIEQFQPLCPTLIAPVFFATRMQKITNYFTTSTQMRRQELTTSKPCLFDLIPNELLCRIFLFAASSTFGDPPLRAYWEEDVKHLSSYWSDFRPTLQLVCRRWLEVARSSPLFWSTIHYRGLWFKDGALSSITHYCGNQLHRAGPTTPIALNITIDSYERVQDDMCDYLMLHSERIKSLRLVLRCEIPTWILSAFGVFSEQREYWYASFKHCWTSFPPPTLSTGSIVGCLTHVEIVMLANEPWPEETRGPDGWTYLLLPSLSRLQHLSHLAMRAIPFRGPRLSSLAKRVKGTPSNLKLPFHSLEELSLQELDSGNLSILGMMDVPNLRMLAIDEYREPADPQQPLTKPTSGWEESNFPISLPCVTHILLYNMSNDIVTHEYLLQKAPSVTHLVISARDETRGCDPECLILREPTYNANELVPPLCPDLQELTVCLPRGKLQYFEELVTSRLPTLRKLRLGKGQVDRMENYRYWCKKHFVAQDKRSGKVIEGVLEVMDCDFPHFEGESARMTMMMTRRR